MTHSLRDLGGALQPDVELSAAPLTSVEDADVVALPFLAGGDALLLGPGAAELLESLQDAPDLLALLEHHGCRGRAGEVVTHPVLTDGALRMIVLVGVGDLPGDFRRSGAALARHTRDADRVVTSVASLAHDAGLRAFVEGLVLGSFRFDLKTGTEQRRPPTFVLAGTDRPGDRQEALARGLATARAGWLSRTLAQMPSQEKNPAWLADRAAELAAERGLDIEVWDEQALDRDGFGGILGVGRASDNPPRLVRLGYRPASGWTAGRRAPHVVLVGKGITFDTGGLSLKPSDSMATMKRDMTGAGVVLAVLGALGEVGCRVRVTGLMACAENSVSGRATRPGDVLRHYGGRTSEVTNTDAEGRLVLADALSYAVSSLDPTVVVDVATLTGAMKVALGQRTGGIFATDEALAGHLLDAGRASGEPLWRLPLVEDYRERLESPVADADNAAGGPGAITAALFLQAFVGSVPWAHLDIASVGDTPADAYEWSAGASGFGARVLLHWLELRDPLAGVAAASSGRRSRRS